MNQLVPINKTTIGGTWQDTVDARTLHAALGSKRDFSNWITYRTQQMPHKFQEGRDFLVFNISVVNPRGGRPRKDYFLTLNMAKHLCLMEQTDAGHRIRDYFIEIEKKHWHDQGKPSLIEEGLTGGQALAPTAPVDSASPVALAQAMMGITTALLATARANEEAMWRLDQQETKVASLSTRVEDVLAQEGHMTVLGYSLTHGLELSSKTLGGIGRRETRETAQKMVRPAGHKRLSCHAFQLNDRVMEMKVRS